MRGQASGAQQQQIKRLAADARRARSLRRRSVWIAAIGLAAVLLSTHWVWAVIATLFTLFLVFAVDDEAAEIERDR